MHYIKELSWYHILHPSALSIVQANCADFLSATAFALRPGGFNFRSRGIVCGHLGVRVRDGDLGNEASLADVWRIGAETSLAGSCSGTRAPVTWQVIGTEGLSPLVTEMGVPDNAITGGLGILDIKRNLRKPYFDLEPQLKTSLRRAKSSEINVSLVPQRRRLGHS